MVLSLSQQLFLTGPKMVLSGSQHLFSTPVVNELKNNIILPLVVLFELGKLREEECMRLEYKYK